MPSPVRILVVEDEQIVAKDIQRTLQSLGYEVPEIVDSGDAAIELVEQLQPSLVLMDIRIRGPMDGIVAASVVRERWDIPVVYLTAHADPATLERAKIADPFGYVLKPFEERELHATVEMALYKHQLDRKLRESERWLTVTLSSIGDGVIATDNQGRIVFINPVAQTLTGWTADEARGRPLVEVFQIINEHTRKRVQDPVAAVLASGQIVGLANHTILIARDGTERPIDDSGAPIKAAGGALQGVVLVFRDITKRRQAECELLDSERRFRALASHAPVGIFETDAEGSCIFVNERWCEMAGMSAEQAQGQGWVAALHPEDRERVIADWYEAARSGREFTSDYRFVSPAGKTTWLTGSAIALRGENGEVDGYIGTVTDFTRRKQAEDVLRGVQAELQIVTDSMLTQVSRCSRDLHYRWVSRHYADWLGLPSEEIIGRPIADVVGREAFEQMSPQFQRVLQGERVEYEQEVNFRSIGRRWIRAACTPTASQDGAVDGWVAVVIDITQRRRLENALKEADRRKDEFLATLAHELRNPLAPIRSSVGILKTHRTADSDLISARDIIDRQVQHMTRLLDDLLDVNRITTGKLELRRARVELAGIIDTAVETTRSLMEAKGHRLSLVLPPEPIEMEADVVRLAQVFSNLLNNAAKYTDPGGHIKLTAERQGTDVLVSVLDDGIGISAEALPRIFDMFSQVSPALERSEGGLGIGLSLVKGLVELQGGSIVAQSGGLGQGSEFIVRLPAASGAPKGQVRKERERNKTKSVVQRRILVVDDVKDSADSLARLMRILGHHVETAYDGEQAIYKAEAMQPDLVLLDIGMPNLNGYETCLRMRKHPWGEKLVIVALTGWGQEEDRRRTAEAGFSHHLVKPVGADALSSLLASLPVRP